MNELSSSSANHPLASELADFASGRLDGEREDELTPHVRACTKCSTSLARFRRAADELPATDDAPWDPEIVETAVVPAAALAAVRGADRPSGGPRPGELWRARPPEGGEVTLVLVRSATRAGIRAVPVSFDVELAGADALIVDAEQSPLGVPLAFHVSVETTLDRAALLDRLGATDIAERLDGVSAGTAVGSALDERIEYRAALADSAAALGQAGDEVLDTELDRWSVIDHRTAHADLFVAMHEALGESHPGARVTPAPVSAAGPAGVTAVASVSELDAFVLVAILDGAEAALALESAHEVLRSDQLLNAVCLVEPAAPFMSVVIDRRDVVAAIETPSGALRPPRQSRPAAPIGDALTKFLDSTISPFGRLARTVVHVEAVDARGLAVDVAADAVRNIAAAARTYKVEGKRPGYERVTRHKGDITRVVQEALSESDVDVESILEDTE